jgi:hypothetical protein
MNPNPATLLELSFPAHQDEKHTAVYLSIPMAGHRYGLAQIVLKYCRRSVEMNGSIKAKRPKARDAKPTA